jgi:uncharacterized protein YxjI
VHYALRQKLVSFGTNFTIEGEDGSRYEVKGEPITIFDKISLQDADGNELVHIDLTVERWRGVYEIHRSGQLLADVRRDLFAIFPRHRFTIETGSTGNLEAVGDFLDLEYFIRRGGRQIARFTKQWFHLSDTWGIDIDDKEPDKVFVLALAVIIARARERLWSRG